MRKSIRLFREANSKQTQKYISKHVIDENINNKELQWLF